MLHPFIKAVSIGIEQFVPATYPVRPKIVSHCAPVSWAEVASKAGLPSIAAVDIGLRTMILGLKAESSNQEYADKIESMAASQQVLDPVELPLGAELITDPNPLITEALNGLKYSVVKQVGEKALWRREDLRPNHLIELSNRAIELRFQDWIGRREATHDTSCPIDVLAFAAGVPVGGRAG